MRNSPQGSGDAEVAIFSSMFAVCSDDAPVVSPDAIAPNAAAVFAACFYDPLVDVGRYRTDDHSPVGFQNAFVDANNQRAVGFAFRAVQRSLLKVIENID